MAEVVRNLIQYEGLSEDIPENSGIFKQLNVEMNYCLPEAKPDVEQILKVITEPVLKSKSVVKTPKGVSLEGQLLTGHKLVVEGALKLKLQYVADEPAQSVHAAHTDIPFSTYLVLPDNFIPGTPVNVKVYVEDVYAQKMSSRCIFINITILLTANYCQ